MLTISVCLQLPAADAPDLSVPPSPSLAADEFCVALMWQWKHAAPHV